VPGFVGFAIGQAARMPVRGEVTDLERAFGELEERFWTEGSDYYEAHTAGGCVMVFPEPVGRLDRDAVITAIRTGPRWDRVVLTDTFSASIDQRVSLFTYRAAAQRDDGVEYAALASSMYVYEESAWLLVFHQQTPVP
jgi:hypothetical protein